MKTNRREFLSRMSVATAAFAVPASVHSSFRRFDDFIEVEITHGKIRGVRNQGVNLFKGILMQEMFQATGGLEDLHRCNPGPAFVMLCNWVRHAIQRPIKPGV